ncbi:hypothetical protein [Ascidiimonas aurantiaca]|uniref:hypothetical protein n=1 Tax=Ascidiimonas aurantiaca TaxID=1685432 RepID=UPI0030ECD900
MKKLSSKKLSISKKTISAISILKGGLLNNQGLPTVEGCVSDIRICDPVSFAGGC